MQVYRFILSNLDHYKNRFLLAIGAGFVNSIGGLAVPLLLAEFTKTGLDRQDLTVLIMLLLAAITVSLAVSWFIRRYGEALAQQYQNHLQQKYFDRLEQLPLASLAKHHSGYTTSLVNQIAGAVTTILFDTFWTFTGIITNIGFLIYFTATKSWGLTALNLVVFVAFIIISTLLARNMTVLADKRSKTGARLGEQFIDFMSNLTTIKRLGIKSFAQATLQKRAADNNAAIQTFQNAHAARWLLLHTIYYGANFVTIAYLLYEISIGAMPASLLILFLSFYGNIRAIIERIAENIITFAEVRVYINNLEDVLSDQLVQQASVMPKSWERLSLLDIEYRHDQNAATIRIPELVITRGQKVCLYGTSGEGKTTAINLIANYLEPKKGTRMIDNTPYSAFGAAWFSANTAFISQETELFNLSIKDNLSLGAPIKEAKIRGLLDDLALGDWLGGLKHGLDTIVGEKGTRLSAGQKQRLNIARGILLDRAVYFLDEPTSHLDDVTERIVVAALKKYLAGKTVIVVTHRPAIKKMCDAFYTMQDHTLRPE
jgi:ABC-type bacteriocin/lantibiotic exporter with double-glycine peptidase domain